jgi:8-oxo-dGTP diphosphatase
VGKKKPEKISLSVDLVLFSLVEGTLSVLVNRRERGPFKGARALPRATVDADETLDQACRRSMREQGGVKGKASRLLHLEQVAAFDSLGRDPRQRTVSVAHLSLAAALPLKKKIGAQWASVERVERDGLPFDQDDILAAARAWLRRRIRHTTIASRLLPETFRIETLQGIYEAFLGHGLNRTNFRGKLLKLGLIQRVGHLPEAVGKKGGRPPHLYCFSSAEVEVMERDFV